MLGLKLIHFSKRAQILFRKVRFDRFVLFVLGDLVICLHLIMITYISYAIIFTISLPNLINICYMVGVLNIDFLKAGEHRATVQLFDILYCNNVFPLITKPT